MKPATLNIATIKTVSLVDEPGKSVAVVHLQGCNFDCSFCHSASLIPFTVPTMFTLSLDAFIKEISEVFLIDGVVFTGGEPLLQQGIVAFLKAVKERFDVACVDTNGSNPRALRLVSPHASRVAMDIKAPLEKYAGVVRRNIDMSDIQESIAFLCDRSRETGRVEFRITHVPPLLSIEDLLAVGDLLHELRFSEKFNSNLVLQQYVPSEGVRAVNKHDFTTVPHGDLVFIARALGDCGIPVAVRSREKGYVKIA